MRLVGECRRRLEVVGFAPVQARYERTYAARRKIHHRVSTFVIRAFHSEPGTYHFSCGTRGHPLFNCSAKSEFVELGQVQRNAARRCPIT